MAMIYDFSQTIKRIENKPVIHDNITYYEFIPFKTEMPYYTTMFVYGTVLSIRFNIKRNILDGYNETDKIEQ